MEHATAALSSAAEALRALDFNTSVGVAVALLAIYFLSGESTSAPLVTIHADDDESKTVLDGKKKYDPDTKPPAGKIPCWDPATLDYLGEVPVSTPAAIRSAVVRAKAAQALWGDSPFVQRRLLMRTLLRFVVANQDTIARVACRDSGKPPVDAFFGEILVTCEKLKWMIARGEGCLADEHREAGTLMPHKRVRVEYKPLGVIGAIVPWNYPFHNVINPIIAALFSGNAIVIKVSEYASWSVKYYSRMIQACLAATGCPTDLVQFVTGYGEAGNALVTDKGVDKIIFVGSPGVGAKVMEAASANLTPVCLELGGKDPFIVCEDADISAVGQVACRGVFQNMGQNCAGPERFFVYDGCYDAFCTEVSGIVGLMKTGAGLLDATVDCGAITMGPRQMLHYQKLVDDAVRKGARVLSGGYIPKAGDPLASGSFYPPTVVADIPETALLADEEIFGPIMAIFRVKGNSDDEAVRMANNCSFGLSSCAFSASQSRAAAIASQLRAGMTAVNDLEGTTYMSQSLPFGGVGASGFDRFAGPEGLRGLCLTRSVCEDRIPFVRTTLPGPLQYPSKGTGVSFASGLIQMVYGYGITQRLSGLGKLMRAVLGLKCESI